MLQKITQTYSQSALGMLPKEFIHSLFFFFLPPSLSVSLSTVFPFILLFKPYLFILYPI